jgi:hypothetical protein
MDEQEASIEALRKSIAEAKQLQQDLQLLIGDLRKLIKEAGTANPGDPDSASRIHSQN